MATPQPTPTPSERRAFRFTFEISVPPAASSTRVWVPRPIDEPWQRELACALPPGVPAEAGTEARTGNRTVCLQLPPSEAATALEVSFDVERRLRRHPRPPEEPFAAPPGRDPLLARLLRPDRKVPLEGIIGEQARKLGAPGEPPLRLARRAFDHLLETLRYDPAGCTPDRFDQLGDLGAACDLRTGTCTEFHGLFVGYLRALGVPARFTFGFNIPRGAREGRIKGYHCWSQVALPSGEWFPVDVSEAWKHPGLAEFFFGSLDADRVAFTSDRDVDLVPSQAAGPIDKFIFPYCESGGAKVTPELGFRFADL